MAFSHTAAPDHSAEQRAVLLIKDEPRGLRRGQKILEDMGCLVLTAPDAGEAARMYRDRAGEIALVIMDMIMPQPAGREVMERLRRFDPDVKILVVTGGHPAKAAEAMRGRGAAAVITKPYTENELAEAFRQALYPASQDRLESQICVA